MGFSVNFSPDYMLALAPTVLSRTPRLNRMRTPPVLTDDFIAFFLGLLDGDGVLSISVNGLYVKCQLSIEINIRDLELLNWLCNTLGVGSVITRGSRPNMAIYRVSGKNDLLLVIIALICYNGHSLLTGNRYWQFIQILDVLTSRVVFYNDLKLFDWNKPRGLSVLELLALPYFDHWLVGFTVTEGSFGIKPSDGSAFFSISQTLEPNLIEAIQQRFGFSYTINPNKDGSYELQTTSVAGIQAIIDFYTSPDVFTLRGYKLEQFKRFCSNIQTIPRYRNVRVPAEYLVRSTSAV